MQKVKIWLQAGCALLRQLSGDDAYERYLIHQAQQHPADPPLDRRAFYRQAQQRKWHGVKRCC